METVEEKSNQETEIKTQPKPEVVVFPTSERDKQIAYLDGYIDGIHGLMSMILVACVAIVIVMKMYGPKLA